jgi:gentisate 1,2-dioxygenase
MPNARDGYFDDLAQLSFGPGWAKKEPSLYPSPKRDFLPFLWTYEDARAALHEAGEFVSVEVAERRNLICVNPKEGNLYGSTPTLVAAYQMVLPHESPRAHHHTPNALRVALDVSPGTHTIVNGTRIDMSPGDVLLTPNWHWHGHGNDSEQEAYWIDLLDVPLVQSLGPMFFEEHPDRVQSVENSDPDSAMRIRTFEVVAAAPADAAGVRRVSFGSDHLVSMEIEAISVPAGSSLPPRQTSANNIYITLQGSCAVDIESEGPSFTTHRGDVLSVPGWWRHAIRAQEDSVLIRATDEPLLRHLGLCREKQF